MTFKSTSMELVKIFTNRSLITQLTTVFILLMLFWFAGAYKFMNNLFNFQLITQAETMVNNAEALGDHVSQNGRFWIKSGADYGGKWIDKIASPDGQFFYSKNPAMIQREFSDQIYANGFPARFRLTALDVMNPNNAPNDFERKALTEIKASLSQNPKHQYTNNKFEYVKPIYYVASCLACHGDVKSAPASVRQLYGETNGYGYKVGDLAGALSVSIEVDKSKLIGDVVDSNIIIFIVLPTFLFFAFVFRLTKYISKVSTQISSYQRGQPIGINTHTIDKNSSNELHGLIQSIAAVMELMEGTYKQVLMLTDRLKSADKKEPGNGK